METNNTAIVVNCTETNPGCRICNVSHAFETLGLYHSMGKAENDINLDLLKRIEKIKAFYDYNLAEFEKEINSAIGMLADLVKEHGVMDEKTKADLKGRINQLRKLQDRYRSNRIPEILIQKDEEGRIYEITARDETNNWTCSYDIMQMIIQ